MIDHSSIQGLKNGIVASCQADRGSPMWDAQVIAAVAAAAVKGGAKGVRIDTPEHIAAVRRFVNVPIVGIFKQRDTTGQVWITPSRKDAEAVAAAGADILAVDATLRPRPIGDDTTELIEYVRFDLGLPVMADIDSAEAAKAAVSSGADVLATTLAGYIGEAEPPGGPDLHLVKQLVEAVDVPVVAEGRYSTPEQVAGAFAMGAFAVVVGTAISDPEVLTQRFVRASPAGAGGRDSS